LIKNYIIKGLTKLKKKDNMTAYYDDDINTTFFKACSEGDITKVADLVLNCGVDVNIKDKNGIAALTKASIYGQETVVEFLLTAGAH
jgi:ankyrin repeat protein